MKITTYYPFPPEIWVNIFQKLTTKDKTVARRICFICNEIILNNFPLFEITRELTIIVTKIGIPNYKLYKEMIAKYFHNQHSKEILTNKDFYLKKEEYHLEYKNALECDLKICPTDKHEIIEKLLHKHADAYMTYKYIFRGIFNGKENFLKLPIHYLSKYFFEEAEFINYITPNELKYPVMRGKDNLNRIYFTVRGTASFKSSQEVSSHPFCITFFHNSNGAWICGHDLVVQFIDKPFLCKKGIIKPEYSRVVDLLQGKAVKVRDDSYYNEIFTFKIDNQ